MRDIEILHDISQNAEHLKTKLVMQRVIINDNYDVYTDSNADNGLDDIRRSFQVHSNDTVKCRSLVTYVVTTEVIQYTGCLCHLQL